MILFIKDYIFATQEFVGLFLEPILLLCLHSNENDTCS